MTLSSLTKAAAMAATILASTAVSAQGIPVYDNASMLNFAQQLIAMEAQRAIQQQVNEVQSKALSGTELGAAAPAIQQQMGTVTNNIGKGVIGSGVDAARQRLNEAYGQDAAISNREAGATATVDTVRAASMHAAQQQAELEAEAQRIDRLQQQSARATGVVEVQQAANEINVELLQQQQKMRARQIVQDQANNAALLDAQQQRRANAEVLKKIYGGVRQ